MLKIFHVDAFTNEPFKGNPAAVCVLDKERSSAWMQAVAAEMNLSETAFVDSTMRLRWFTPKQEVALCGHATLATAHVFWSEGLKSDSELRFETLSGTLTAQKKNSYIELNFPRGQIIEGLHDIVLPVEFTKDALFIGYVEGTDDYPNALIELPNAQNVRDLVPNLDTLRRPGAPNILITARGEGDIDFISRYFAPGFGIDEDPVTGAAHCALASYWAKKFGRTKLRGYQASNRGGFVDVELVEDRVLLLGQAITLYAGVLRI